MKVVLLMFLGIFQVHFSIADELSPQLKVEQLIPHVFIVTHVYPWPANSMIVEMKNSDLVIVDTPWTPEAMKQVLVWAEHKFGKRKMVAINTHYHTDRLGGNQALLEQKVPIYGSDLTLKLLRKNHQKERDTLVHAAQSKDPAAARVFEVLKLEAPTQSFLARDGLRLNFGSEKVDVFYPGSAHSPDNVVVYFEEKRVLFGGCMIVAGDRFGNLADADLKNWGSSLKALERFKFEWLIPGHGDIFAPASIANTYRLLELQKNLK